MGSPGLAAARSGAAFVNAIEAAGGSGDVLIVFLKAPRAGSVKTRLARSIGDLASAQD